MESKTVLACGECFKQRRKCNQPPILNNPDRVVCDECKAKGETACTPRTRKTRDRPTQLKDELLRVEKDRQQLQNSGQFVQGYAAHLEYNYVQLQNFVTALLERNKALEAENKALRDKAELRALLDNIVELQNFVPPSKEGGSS